jgi:glycerate dehydrogenase
MSKPVLSKTRPKIHALSLIPMSAEQKQRLEQLGELRYFDAVLGDPEFGEKCRGAEILVTTPRLHLDILEYLPGCRFISVQGTGTDALNVAAARERGMLVSNVPDFCREAASEHAWALLLAVAKRLERGRSELQEGRWRTALAYSTLGLHGRTLGLFGCGKIGSRIAEIGRAFGMRVLATTRSPSSTPFERLLAESDFIVIAAPATPETRGRFNTAAFRAMKRGSVLVNVSRAAVVDDAALLAALDAGHLAGAAVDVFSEEPPPLYHPLLHHPGVFVSPHVAWGSEDAAQRLVDGSIANVEAFLAGHPTNLVP